MAAHVSANDAARALVDELVRRRPTTALHSSAVANLTTRLAGALDLDESQRSLAARAALLHDVGKLDVPTTVLLKPGRLTADEFAQVREHSVTGASRIAAYPALEREAQIVRAVHERWDGSGYPDGVAGEQIEPLARLIAVCDAFDAMVSDRGYREPLTTAAALGQLQEGRGLQFDATIVDTFVSINPVRDRRFDRSGPSSRPRRSRR